MIDGNQNSNDESSDIGDDSDSEDHECWQHYKQVNGKKICLTTRGVDLKINFNIPPNLEQFSTCIDVRSRGGVRSTLKESRPNSSTVRSFGKFAGSIAQCVRSISKAMAAKSDRERRPNRI